MVAISIRDLRKSYGAAGVVDGVNLEIPSGSFASILGPSGCGKTTLLRILAGFIAPDQGEITVGETVLSTPGRVVAPERRDMGMVFQQYAIWPHLNAFENVAFGLEVTRTPKAEIEKRVRDALRLVGLQGNEFRSPAELSGGQQQRLAVARALVTRPSVLLLDEPLSNLDARLRERMRFELKDLQTRTGITFVYVTHDQVEAMSMSDSVAVMRDGVVVQQGTPRQLYEEPMTPFVIDFLGLANWFDGVVERVDTERGTAVVRTEGGLLLEGGCGPGVAPSDRVRVAVRPEDLVVSPDPAEGPNVIEGTVLTSMFMGGYCQYSVDVKAKPGADLILQAGRGMRLADGAHLRLVADASLVRVLAADGDIAARPQATARPGVTDPVAAP